MNIQDKNLLSIGKLAKLTGVTIETLRHYDKKGILTPDFIDPQTNYRYYSILQYYKLELILELREIGMSIEDIKNYLDKQSIKTSLELFEEQSKQTKLLIKKLEKIDQDITAKIHLLNKFKDIEASDDIRFRHIPKREIITSNSVLTTDDEMAYSFLEFDMQVYEDVLPTLVPYGFFIRSQVDFNNLILFFIVHDLKKFKNFSLNNISIIPENLFACLYIKCTFNELNKVKLNVVGDLKQKGYIVCDEIIVLPLIDVSLSNIESEHLHEIQIPIKKI
ncbi:MAG: helix-turn-helix domain-containing protein [bacterium]